MKAEQIMTRDLRVVTPADPVEYAAELMENLDVGLLPVVRDRATMRLEGVITDHDIVTRHVAAAHAGGCTVADHMTSAEVDLVRPYTNVHDVIRFMADRHVHRVLVVDNDERVLGVIAAVDLELRLGACESHAHPSTVESV